MKIVSGAEQLTNRKKTRSRVLTSLILKDILGDNKLIKTLKNLHKTCQGRDEIAKVGDEFF